MAKILRYSVLVLLGLLVASCSNKVNEGPLLKNEAQQKIDLPLANSATNIFFYENVGGLQSLDRFVRIDVSIPELTNQVDLIVNDNNRTFKRALPYTKTNLAASKIITPFDNTKLNWWTPQTVTDGFYVGENESYAVQIWVDKTKGRLFIHQGD